MNGNPEIPGSPLSGPASAIVQKGTASMKSTATVVVKSGTINCSKLHEATTRFTHLFLKEKSDHENCGKCELVQASLTLAFSTT